MNLKAMGVSARQWIEISNHEIIQMFQNKIIDHKNMKQNPIKMQFKQGQRAKIAQGKIVKLIEFNANKKEWEVITLDYDSSAPNI